MDAHHYVRVDVIPNDILDGISFYTLRTNMDAHHCEHRRNICIQHGVSEGFHFDHPGKNTKMKP